MKTAVITGANRGIGLELCRHLKNQNYKVIGVCREKTPELNSLDISIIESIDLTKSECLTRLASLIEDKTIDVLINNAGLLTHEAIGELDRDSIRAQFEINALAPLMLTEALLNKMKNPSKIAMITSRMGSIADNGSGGYYGYRASKAALNAFGKSLAIDLKKQNIAVALLHPGFVQTRMVDFRGDITPAVAAANLIQRIDQLTLANTGSFWHANGEQLPW